MAALDRQGQTLLAFLVSRLGQVVPGEPQTYLGYKEAHDALNLKLIGPDYGESLKNQGLLSLANWVVAERKPAITGIIVNQTTVAPGIGYFSPYGRTEYDFEWWTEQVRLSKSFDWRPYLSERDVHVDGSARDIANQPDTTDATEVRAENDWNQQEVQYDFEEWMTLRGLSRSSVLKYAGALNGVLTDWAKQNSIISGSLTDITNADEFRLVSEQIKELPIFLERNSTGHTMYSNALARYAEYLDDQSSSDEIEQDIDAILTSEDLSPTEKAAFVKARMGQGVFRKKLIDYWKGCSVTAFPRIDLLVASHIKPWKASSNFERLDVFNGLLLRPNLDRAFELGYISFNEKGMIIISPTLGHPELIGIDSAMRLNVAPEHQKYLDYHRTCKFKKTIA